MHEVYSTCKSACPVTCQNRFDAPRPCPLYCVGGCSCEENYIRDESSGNCVKPEYCPPRIECKGLHEVYTTCGSACPVTCQNRFDAPKPCPLICSGGCTCKENYIRDEYTGNCVKPEHCPTNIKCAGLNEVYSTCGSACPVTCQNRFDEPKFCPLYCVEGCTCEKDYIRDECSGHCVKPDYCPTVLECKKLH